MFRLVNGGEKLPQRATRYSAGFDVFANENVVIGAGQTKPIGLGIVIDYDAWHKFLVFEEGRGLFKNFSEFMDSHYFALHLRSSLRVKGLTSLGTGIIDMDYRDEIKMIVHNPITDIVNTEEGVYYNGADNCSPYRINRGDKIGQLILCKHEGWLLLSEYTLDAERNGGFGSTSCN